MAALHPPSAEGDQRNYHVHIVTSFRPAVRVDRYQWQLGRAPRTDLDNPEMFREMRRDFASIMTAVVQVAGKDRVYTHLSHAERGLAHKPGEHLGAHKTKRARAGEYVAANERNRRVIADNQARERVEHIDQRMASLRRRINRMREIAGRTVSPFATIREVAMSGGHPAKQAVLSPGGTTDRGRSFRLPVTAEVRQARRLGPKIFAPDAASVKRVRATSIIAQVDSAARPDVRRPADIAQVTQRSTSVVLLRPLKTSQRQSDARRKLSSLTIPSPPNKTDVRRLSVVVVPKAEEPRTGRVLRAIGRIGDVARPKTVSARTLAAQPTAPEPLSNVNRRPTTLPAVSQAPVDVRSLSVVHAVDRVDTRAAAPLRPFAIPIKEQKTEPRRPSSVEPPRQRQPEPVRWLDIDMWSSADLECKVKAVEREQKEAEQALEKRAAAERAVREHANFIRYLGLIALNPHWLDRSEAGLAPSKDMPVEGVKRFEALRSAPDRRTLMAEARRGALDGVHRLPPAIAAELANELITLAPEVAKITPPPLVEQTEAGRRHTGMFETALAVLAETPAWLVAKDRTVSVSPDAPPAVTRAIVLYGAHENVPKLLNGLKRHATGGDYAFGPVLRCSIDTRRASLARGRHQGSLKVLADTPGQLTPAMVDHLAQLKLHPEWIIGNPHLGLGVSAAASPLFKAQWCEWDQPNLARALVAETMGIAAHPFALTPAMRSQVVARVREITGNGGGGPAGGVRPLSPNDVGSPER